MISEKNDARKYIDCFRILLEWEQQEEDDVAVANSSASLVKPIGINATDSNGETVLHSFIYNMKNIKMSENMTYYLQWLDLLLSSKSIDIEAKDGKGRTAIHLAAYYGIYNNLFPTIGFI